MGVVYADAVTFDARRSMILSARGSRQYNNAAASRRYDRQRHRRLTDNLRSVAEEKSRTRRQLPAPSQAPIKERR